MEIESSVMLAVKRQLVVGLWPKCQWWLYITSTSD